MGASGRQKSWQGPQETDCGTLPLDLRSLRASYGGQGVRKDLRGLERRTVLGRKALGYRFGRTCVTCVCVSRLRWPLTLVSTVPPALGDPLRCEYARVEWRFGASDRDQRTSIGRIEGHNQEDPPAVTTHRLTLHGEYGIVTHYLVTFVPPGEHEVQAREEGEVAHVLGKAAVHRRY